MADKFQICYNWLLHWWWFSIIYVGPFDLFIGNFKRIRVTPNRHKFLSITCMFWIYKKEKIWANIQKKKQGILNFLFYLIKFRLFYIHVLYNFHMKNLYTVLKSSTHILMISESHFWSIHKPPWLQYYIGMADFQNCNQEHQVSAPNDIA